MTTVAVLGMHRSGTSALARALNRMGATLGDARDLDHNWEHTELRGINTRMLAKLGGAWDGPPALEPGWERDPRLALLGDYADTLLQPLLARSPFAWKDPRTCLTLPWWLPRLGDALVVFVYRHPEEVVGSLHARDGFGPAQGLALWELYNVAALTNARGLPVYALRYDELLREPVAACDRVRAALAQWGVALGPGADGAVELDAAKARNRSASSELSHPAATPSQRAVWQLLGTLDGAHDVFAPPSFPAPDAASTELLAAVASRRACERELHRVTHSRRELATLFARRARESVSRRKP
ncbi:MAG: Sulfotransferase family [Actinomycetia bacterium]|nr:Sulfotransferase family [Actinomycetes bacterium]